MPKEHRQASPINPFWMMLESSQESSLSPGWTLQLDHWFEDDKERLFYA